MSTMLLSLGSCASFGIFIGICKGKVLCYIHPTYHDGGCVQERSLAKTARQQAGSLLVKLSSLLTAKENLLVLSLKVNYDSSSIDFFSNSILLFNTLNVTHTNLTKKVPCIWLAYID